MSDFIKVYLVCLNGHRYYVKLGFLDEFFSSVSDDLADSFSEVSFEYVFASRFKPSEHFKFM